MAKGRWLIGRSAKRMPEDIKVSGATTVAFGCETCPGRREVTVAILGGISLTSKPDAVPFAVTTETQVEAKDMRAFSMTVEVVALDQKSCERPSEVACPYAEIIAEVADGIEAHPAKLEWQHTPPVQETRYPRIV